jgi:hypothetical protein
MLILNAPVAVAPVESDTAALNAKLPACDGTPEMEPPELIERPGGRLPDETDHL